MQGPSPDSWAWRWGWDEGEAGSQLDRVNHGHQTCTWELGPHPTAGDTGSLKAYPAMLHCFCLPQAWAQCLSSVNPSQMGWDLLSQQENTTQPWPPLGWECCSLQQFHQIAAGWGLGAQFHKEEESKEVSPRSFAWFLVSIKAEDWPA